MSVQDILTNGKISSQYYNGATFPNIDIDQVTGLESALTVITDDIVDINNSVGQPNGICPLNALGQINPSFFDPSVFTFEGAWDASIGVGGVPTLVNGVGNTGDMYIASAGGVQFGETFIAGDFCVYANGLWEKIASGSNSVTSVTAGLNIAVSGIAQNPVVSTVVQPTFDRVSSTLAPATALHCTNKNYVDTLDGANVKSVSTGNVNLLTVTGTAQNPILTPLIGGGEALLYQYRTTTNNPTANEIKFNHIDFASATQMLVRYDALNRYDTEYLKEYLSTQLEAIPFKVILINSTDGTKYAEFFITAIASVGANFITFTCSFDAVASVIIGGGAGAFRFADITVIKWFMIDVQRTLTGTGRISSTIITPKTIQFATTAELNTVANVGVGTGLIFRDKIGENFNLKSLVAGTAISITNGANDLTIASTGVNTASNVGFSDGDVFKEKSGVNLVFRRLNTNGSLSISTLADTVDINTDKSLIGLSNVSNEKNNYLAIVPPTASNDGSQGYSKSSRWIDTVLDQHWVCVDGTTNGAFVWKNTTTTTADAITTSTTGTYITPSFVQTNLDQLDTQLAVISSQTTTLAKSSKLVASLNARIYNTATYNQYGSANITFGGTDGAFDQTFILKSHVYPNMLTQGISPKRTFIAIRLYGSNWAGGTLTSFTYGMVSNSFVENLETNITVVGDHYSFPYSVATGYGIAAQWGTVVASSCYFWGIPSKSLTAGTRTGTNIVDVTTAQNDYVIFWVNESTNTYTAQWYNSAFVLQSTGTIPIPQGNTHINNFTANSVHGAIVPARKGVGWEMSVLTQRELTAIGFSPVSDGTCLFQF